MKYTSALEVIQGDEPQGDTLRIHPNDGFDIGLMTYMYELKIFNNCSAEEFNSEEGSFFLGRVEQANECQLGTMEVNYKFFKKLGSPERIKIIASDNKLLLLHLHR